MKPKVLHIFSGYGGGVSSLILNLVENSYKEIDFTLLAFSFNNGEKFLERMAATNTNALTMARPRKDGIIKFCQSIDNAFKTTKFDAVHCHIDGWPLIVFRFFAKKYDINTFIVHAHKTSYEKKIDRTFLVHSFNRWCNYKCSTHYMTCSDLAAQYLYGKRYLNIRQAYLIPNGMNESLFNDLITDYDIKQYKKEFGIQENELILCHVGRMTFAKNHDFILNIAQCLKNKGFKYKLLLVGNGELECYIKRRVDELNLKDIVCLTGRRLDIAKLMQYSDMLILPSLSEGLPTVAVECQAAGTPMFLSDTITKQCDLDLGLLTFLPLDVETWVNKIMEFKSFHLPIKQCCDTIREKQFTAERAGHLYANYIKAFINSSK